MSWKYRKDKPDAVTEKIVEELRARGYEVVYLGQPTDVLVRHKTWCKNWWRLLEMKSRKLKGGQVVLDKRQKEQQQFCETHGVPYVTDVFEARLALGEKVSI
jgi:hypothetical protein